MIIMPVTGTSMGILDLGGWCEALATEPELLCELMDRLVDRRLAEVESIYAAVGDRADMVFGLGDDVASQAALWMSPEHYRRYVKPRHARIVRFIKARTRAKIIFHCCGACRAILPDLIEIGVDVFNPTQTAAAGMDPFELKRDFGRTWSSGAASTSSTSCLAARSPTSSGRSSVTSTPWPRRGIRSLAQPHHPARHAAGERPGDVPHGPGVRPPGLTGPGRYVLRPVIPFGERPCRWKSGISRRF